MNTDVWDGVGWCWMVLDGVESGWCGVWMVWWFVVFFEHRCGVLCPHFFFSFFFVVCQPILVNGGLLPKSLSTKYALSVFL